MELLVIVLVFLHLSFWLILPETGKFSDHQVQNLRSGCYP